MSKDFLFRRLRPFLSPRYQYLYCLKQGVRPFTNRPACSSAKRDHDVVHDYEKRIAQLEAYAAKSQWYPRLDPKMMAPHMDNTSFHGKYQNRMNDGETLECDEVVLTGRVKSMRTAGSKLCFMDVGSSPSVQAVVDLSRLQRTESVDMESFKTFCKTTRKGDSLSVKGKPYRTARGQLSVLASELPISLSPSLHQIPERLDDPETQARQPHVDMLVNPAVAQTLRIRHLVEMTVMEFFGKRGFLKVNTPVLSAGASGAAARSFETEATELAGEKLKLRIAPELWLKRLIVGGLDRVYEIGPSFRNEGVDGTHNPEFSTCEFYQTYATLDDLMSISEALLIEIAQTVDAQRQAGLLSALTAAPWNPGKFSRVEFIPALEEMMKCTLPPLESPEAEHEVMSLCKSNGICIPQAPTLARLLDSLSAHFLEPHSHGGRPVFVTHHPACMSPLSKHFEDPRTGQTVAARAELFINGREFANMYEEENSPFEQRRKFEEQLKQRDTDNEAMESDESYLRALEWGLPPTGGWGCGIDRLVMLFSGRERIADVLPFGTLRNVVGLGKVGRR